MLAFDPNISFSTTAASPSGPLGLVHEPPSQLRVEHINRLRLVLELVILAEQTRRFVYPFENQTTPGRLRLARQGRSGHAVAELRGGEACA
jgi:hypothetical protein